MRSVTRITKYYIIVMRCITGKIRVSVVAYTRDARHPRRVREFYAHESKILRRVNYNSLVKICA